MFERFKANDPEKRIPANFAAACIDAWAGKDGVPVPSAIMGEAPEWMTQAALQPPSAEELLQDPDIRAVAEITDQLQ